MRRLIVARHAESEPNVLGILNADPARPGALSERGRAQARALGLLIADEPVALAVTTPFRRTQETAALALAGRDVPTVVVPELGEHPAGDYEGRPLVDYIAWAHAHGSRVVVPGTTEDRVELARRIARGFRAVLERDEEVVLAVAHKLTVCYLLVGAVRQLPALDYAEAHVLDRDAVEQAVERLERWCEAPDW